MGGTVTTSYILKDAEVLAKAEGTGTASSNIAAGGILGTGSVSNCFSGASVKIETSLKIWSYNAAIGAGGLVGVVLPGCTVENSYATGTVEIIDSHTEGVVFAGGLVGVVRYGTYSAKVTNSTALNSTVKVESANTGDDAVHTYRVVGGAADRNNPPSVSPIGEVSENDDIILLNNYASPDLQPQIKIGSGNWTDVGQGANDTNGLAGDANIELAESFFSGTLQWDFTGEGVWKWDPALGLPVLN
jgi:hypothetical protein